MKIRLQCNSESKFFMEAIPANCACPTPVVTEVPGVQGVAGANGANGVNAYTITSANITIPATGSTVVASMANVSWMAIGQIIFISDGTNLSHFQVTALQTSPPQATIKALGYTGDTAATGVISANASVVPAGVQGTAAFTPLVTQNSATGGSQALNTSPTQALSVSLTLSGAANKTYLLRARCRVDNVGATFAAGKAVTLSLRRTNNTAGTIASSTIMGRIVTTETSGLGEITVEAAYTTVGASDIIQPYVSIEATPSAGAVNVVEASVVALQLS